MVRTARRLGIHSKLHDQPSIALGTAEVTLLELTGAYAPFANGGQGVLPHIITRVRNGDGKVLYERQRSTTGQVVALQYVGAMNDMMNATVTRGTGKQAAIDGQMAAGKTGTTQSYRDAWFVGYTAHYVGGRVDRQRQRLAHAEGHRRHAAGRAVARHHDLRASGQDAAAAAGHARAVASIAIARLPWNAPEAKTTTSRCIRRVFGIFAGQ